MRATWKTEGPTLRRLVCGKLWIVLLRQMPLRNSINLFGRHSELFRSDGTEQGRSMAVGVDGDGAAASSRQGAIEPSRSLSCQVLESIRYFTTRAIVQG